LDPRPRSKQEPPRPAGSKGSNEDADLLKLKTAARHFSYRTIFHTGTVLILAFLLPRYVRATPQHFHLVALEHNLYSLGRFGA
jgi:hypothetical protein